jgi:hypothetical protein
MVSCASSTFCVAASAVEPDVVTFGGQSWSGLQATGGSGPAKGLSCVRGSYCLLVDGAGEVRRFDGFGWTVLSAQPAIELAGISCVSASFCVGSDATGDTVTFDGSAWSSPQQTGATRIQCHATTQCIGLTVAGVPVLYDGQSWRLAPIPHHWGTPVAVSCVAGDLCEAVDDRGAFYAYTDGGWAPFGYGPGASACARRRACDESR